MNLSLRSASIPSESRPAAADALARPRRTAVRRDAGAPGPARASAP